jgi:predicted HicB family RNase H-like nuclease
MERTKRGRPAKQSSDQQSKMLNVRLTPAQHQQFSTLASQDNRSLSNYVRKLLLKHLAQQNT